MARITVEDCLEHVDNRFQLVLLAAKRARQLAMTNAESRVPAGNDKPTILALREIAAGHTHFEEESTTTPHEYDIDSTSMDTER